MITVGDEVRYSKTYLDDRTGRRWGSRRLGKAIEKRGVVVGVRKLTTGWITLNGKQVIELRFAAYVECDGPGSSWVVEWADDLEVTKPGRRYSFAPENVEIPK